MALRREHPGAAHVCWALMAGGQSAANDDGEPGGTAGRPMLEVLRHHDLDGVLATVVRYFGGVKLGAGGLVRAYTDSIAQALIDAPLVPLVRAARPALRGAVCARRPAAPRTRAPSARRSTRCATKAWCTSTSRLPEPSAAAFIARLDDATQGRVAWLQSRRGPPSA